MKLQRALIYLMFPAAASLCVSCQNATALNKQVVREINAAHERYLQELELARFNFEQNNPMPLRLEFGMNGTLVLRECKIAGLPGNEKLWLKFTYLTATGISVENAKVTLTLVDKINELEWSEIMNLSLPFNFRLGHNSSYSSFFEMPLNGLHRSTGWDWRVELESSPVKFAGSLSAR